MNWLARGPAAREALLDAGSGRRWTYAELHLDSLRWTGRLRALGVGAGDRVAVLAPNRGETLALLFACAELRAILVPLNWRLADAELRWQVGHCAPRVLFADPTHLDRLGGEAMDPGDDVAEGPGALADDPWMLMYTSGSTGRPKGAMLTHRQLAANARNTVAACGLTDADSTLTFVPLFHTGGMNCLTTPLFYAGGRVVLTRGFDAGEALRLVVAERITLLMGVPTVFQMLADDDAFDTSDVSCVRDALVGGAGLPMALMGVYRSRGIPLRQGFGLTEVGPNCFSLPPSDIDRKAGTVGRPIVPARLVRPDGGECAVGETGELLLGGEAVCGGYWEDPEATSKAIADGWFHTGDLLSRDEEGFFTVRGRSKEMYKSGGENVYPPEVEAVLDACPGVVMSAVIGVPDAHWGEVGRAFVEVRAGTREEEVRAFLRARLARFKQPKYLHLVDALPRTASGKIDRVALRGGR